MRGVGCEIYKIYVPLVLNFSQGVRDDPARLELGDIFPHDARGWCLCDEIKEP